MILYRRLIEEIRFALTLGSSSGSAVSVSANLVMASLGEETRASTRGPANHNACALILPHKAMTGFVGGAIGADIYCDRSGILCRTIADCAMLDALRNPDGCSYDARDPFTTVPRSSVLPSYSAHGPKHWGGEGEQARLDGGPDAVPGMANVAARGASPSGLEVKSTARQQLRSRSRPECEIGGKARSEETRGLLLLDHDVPRAGRDHRNNLVAVDIVAGSSACLIAARALPPPACRSPSPPIQSLSWTGPSLACNDRPSQRLVRGT